MESMIETSYEAIHERHPDRGEYWKRKQAAKLAFIFVDGLKSVCHDDEWDPVQHDPIHCFRNTVSREDWAEGKGWCIYRADDDEQGEPFRVSTKEEILEDATKHFFEVDVVGLELEIFSEGEFIAVAFENSEELADQYVREAAKMAEVM